VVGSYYLRHETPDLNATLGFVRFEAGLSTKALAGKQLLTYVSVMGRYLTLEPADDAARTAMPESVQASRAVAEPSVETVAPQDLVEEQPSADASPLITDDIDSIENIDALRSIASGLYIDVDPKWKLPRLRAEIRRARGG
jgi:hypothetical protein